jgi:hypothetical protein
MAIWIIASDTSIRLGASGRNGRMIARSSSVRSVGQRLARFSRPAVRPRLARVHIPSLNHTHRCRSIHSQTGSKRNGRPRSLRRSRTHLATSRSHSCAGQLAGLLHPGGELSFVELVVFVDVEVAHVLVLGRSRRERTQ